MIYTLSTSALIGVLTLTLTFLTLKLVRIIARGVGNLFFLPIFVSPGLTPVTPRDVATLTFDMALVGDTGLRAPYLYTKFEVSVSALIGLVTLTFNF